jgi:hypothetical protein
MQGLQPGVGRVTLELRCLECRYLDPKLWRNIARCNCSHYWEEPGILLVQSDLKGPPSGHSWCFLTQQVPNYKNRRPPVGDCRST